jgi:acyl carrier protein
MSTAIGVIRWQIKLLLIEVLKFDASPQDIGDEDLLFDGALGIDSILAIELLVAMENYFGIKVADEEMNDDVFLSVSTLAGLVEQCLGRQAGCDLLSDSGTLP